MKKMSKKKASLGLASGVLALLVAGFGVASLVGAFSGSAHTVIENVENYTEQGGGLGTAFTMNTGNESYTDSGDLRQNVQALVERANRGALDMTEVYPTTTLTAANLCDYQYAYYTATSTALDFQLPTAASIIADCLGTDKMPSVEILLYNASTTASSMRIIAGAGMDLLGSSTSTPATSVGWAGGEYRLLKVFRDTSSNVKALLTSYDDAD